MSTETSVEFTEVGIVSKEDEIVAAEVGKVRFPDGKTTVWLEKRDIWPGKRTI